MSFTNMQVQAGIVDHLVRKNVPGYHLPEPDSAEASDGSQALSMFSSPCTWYAEVPVSRCFSSKPQ